MIRNVDSDIYANLDSDHVPLRITFKLFLKAIQKNKKEERTTWNDCKGYEVEFSYDLKGEWEMICEERKDKRTVFEETWTRLKEATVKVANDLLPKNKRRTNEDLNRNKRVDRNKSRGNQRRENDQNKRPTQENQKAQTSRHR